MIVYVIVMFLGFAIPAAAAYLFCEWLAKPTSAQGKTGEPHG